MRARAMGKRFNKNGDDKRRLGRGARTVCTVIALYAPKLVAARVCAECDATRTCGACDIDLTYAVTPASHGDGPNGFYGEFKMHNNQRDAVSSWQVTWIFADGQGVDAGQVSDALLINPGGPGGQPARVVNRLSNAQIPSGATQGFSFVGRVDDSVMVENIQRVSVNGGWCLPVWRPNGAGTIALDDSCATRTYQFCCGNRLYASPPPSTPPPPAPLVEMQSGPNIITSAARGSTSWLRNGSAMSALVVSCFVAFVFVIEITRHLIRWFLGDYQKDVTLVNVSVVEDMLSAPTKRKHTLPLPGQCFVSKADDLEGITVIPGDHTARFKTGGASPRSVDDGELFQLSFASYMQEMTVQSCSSEISAESDEASSAEPALDANGVGAVIEIHAGSIKLGQLLGQGAYGAVYAGRWNRKVVAVKKLHAASALSKSDLKTFVREVAVLSTVNHPKVVRMFGACLKPGNVCIVEELMDGGSLHALLHVRKRELKMSDILRVALDVASAMQYLHSKSIVHRDLKSHNVLLSSRGAKVCDFGIARALEQTLLSSVASKTNASGSTAGTPAYMAPELFHGDGKAVTTKCDVYSFSVLMWELLARQPPWDWFSNHMQVIFAVAIQSQRLPLNRHRVFARDDVPTRSLVDDIIVPSWQTDPRSRPDFDDIVDALKRLLSTPAL